MNEQQQQRYNVELSIDEIVLHGFAQHDRHAIKEAIQTELTRLLMEQGVSPTLNQGHEAAKVDAGTITVQPGMRPDAIGTQVARSIYKGIGSLDATSEGSTDKTKGYRL